MHARRIVVVAALVVLALGFEGAGGAKAATYLLPSKSLHAMAGSHWTGTGYDTTCTLPSATAPCHVFVDGGTALPGTTGLVCVRIDVDVDGRWIEERGCDNGTVAVDDLLADGSVVARIPSTVFNGVLGDPAQSVTDQHGTISVNLSAIGTGLPYQGYANLCDGGPTLPFSPCFGDDLVRRDARSAATVTGSALGVSYGFSDAAATLAISRSV